MIPATQSNFDAAWKTALDTWIEPFFAHFFPRIHARIDWTRPPQSLEQELQKIQAEDKLGRLSVDKLLRVWRKNGRETWVLIHIEVQSQRDVRFPLRMFQYAARIHHQYKRHPVSLAILGDEFPDWRPSRYVHRRWGTGHVFQFLAFKLLDLQAGPAALMSQPNPFATVAEAHLAALTTRRDAELRFSEKVRLVRRLYEGGLSSDNIRTLFNVIDYLIRLAPESSQRFRAVHHQIEEERNVRLLTQSEELALEEGLEKGLVRGRDEGRIDALLALVDARFGTLPESLETRLHGISADGLRGLVRTAVSARDLPAFLKELDRIQSKSEDSG